MRKVLISLAAVGMSVFSFHAIADEARTQEIIRSLVKSADIGKSRAICIGSEQECKAKPADPVTMRVSFELNSAKLTPGAMQEIDAWAQALQDKTFDVASFEVDGHTDELGSDQYNMDLSVARAEAVAKALAERGVDIKRIKPHGFGETRPLTTTGDTSVNRRVEASVIMPTD